MSSPLEISKGIVWSKANQFKITLTPKLGDIPVSNDVLMASITEITSPDVANENFEEYYAGRYYQALGRNSVYQMSVTFKEIYNTQLYQYFYNYLISTRKKYTDDCSWSIGLFQLQPNRGKKTIFNVDKALLIGISNITYNHSNDQVLEFSCTWKFPLFPNEGTK